MALGFIDGASAGLFVDRDGRVIPQRSTGKVAGWPVTLFADADLGEFGTKVIKVHADSRQLWVAFILVIKGAGHLAFSTGEAGFLVNLDHAGAWGLGRTFDLGHLV